jgi:hypothetical protein
MSWRSAKTIALVAVMTLGLVCAPRDASAQVDHSSRIDSTVTDQGDGTYLYEFTVHNTTVGQFDGAGPLIVDWELPVMVPKGLSLSDMVSQIQSPTGAAFSGGALGSGAISVQPWHYEVLSMDGIIADTSDPFSPGVGNASDYYNNALSAYGQYNWSWTKEDDPSYQADSDVYGGDPDQWLTPDYLIHWYVPVASAELDLSSILPGDSRNGFSFTSGFSSETAPNMASWDSLGSTIGDEFGGTQVPSSSQASESVAIVVPLPAALPAALILLVGIVCTGYLKRRWRI